MKDEFLATISHELRTRFQMSQMLEDVQRDSRRPVEPALLTTEIARLTGRDRSLARRAH